MYRIEMYVHVLHDGIVGAPYSQAARVANCSHFFHYVVHVL